MHPVNWSNIEKTSFDDIPSHIQHFQDDVSGVGMLCEQLRKLKCGDITEVFFTEAVHEDGQWKEKNVFGITTKIIDNRLVFRWIDGSQRSSVVPSYYSDCDDIARVAATITVNYHNMLFLRKHIGGNK